MKGLGLREGEAVCLEISGDSLKLLRGGQGLDLPLERTPDGRLTAGCKEQLTRSVQEFLGRHNWQARVKGYCAISARGVSFRRLALPRTPGAKTEELLRLQIEAEFPLPPEELAWGSRAVPNLDASGTGGNAKAEFLVVAVKKDALADYAALLGKCGIEPVFTLASLARMALKPGAGASFATLDIAENHSEFVAYAGGLPVSARILSWGSRQMNEAVAAALGVSQQEAEKLVDETELKAHGANSSRIQEALEKSVDALAGLMNGGSPPGGTIYLTGQGLRNGSIAGLLARRLGRGGHCEILGGATGAGRSDATLGLQKLAASRPLEGILEIRPQTQAQTTGATAKIPLKLAKIAAALVLGALLLPYAEAIVLKPFLQRRIAAIKAQKPRLDLIDQEYDFLRSLKQEQPPYLDALYLFSKVAPAGTRIESLSMNRHGDVALKLSMRDAQQVGDFRKKLMDSGLYSGVVIDDQTPSPDRQKLNIRITAQWKPLNARAGLALGPTPEEIEKAKNAKRDSPATAMAVMPGTPIMPGAQAMPAMPAPTVMPSSAEPAPAPARGARAGGRRGAVPVVDNQP